MTVATLAGACGRDSAPRPAARDAAAVVRAPDAAVAATVAVDPCSAAEVRSVRERAQAELAAGRAAEAVRILEAMACPIELDQALDRNAEAAWAISDLSFARYKAGDLRGCYATAESQLLPYAGNVSQVFGDDDRVLRALQHNASLCREAIERGWGTFANADCELDPSSHGIPADAQAPGSKPSCLEIAAGKQNADGEWQCGTVTLISGRGTSKPARLPVQLPASPLSDGSRCCNITQVGFARAGDALRIRVDGEGRDCNGGTASSAETSIYELKADTLTLIDTLDAAYH